MLNTIHSEFSALGLSSIDSNTEVLICRPCGGAAILWRKSLLETESIKYDDPRLLGISVGRSDTEVLLINAYLPFCKRSRHELFNEYLMKLLSTTTDSPTVHCVIMGDLNSNMSPDERGFVHHLFFKRSN